MKSEKKPTAIGLSPDLVNDYNNKKRKTDKKVEVDVVNDLKRVYACEVCENTLRADVEVRTQKKSLQNNNNSKRKEKKKNSTHSFSLQLCSSSLFFHLLWHRSFFFPPASLFVCKTPTQIRIITIKEEEKKN